MWKRTRIQTGVFPDLRCPLGSPASRATRVCLPYFIPETASLNGLNENVLGPESASHLAFHITLPHHVGVETG